MLKSSALIILVHKVNQMTSVPLNLASNFVTSVTDNLTITTTSRNDWLRAEAGFELLTRRDCPKVWSVYINTAKKNQKQQKRGLGESLERL